MEGLLPVKLSPGTILAARKISPKSWMNVVSFPAFCFCAFGRVISDAGDAV